MLLFKFVFHIMFISLVMCNIQTHNLKKHVSSQKSFPCKVPQPRVFYIEDLIKENMWNNNYEVQDNIIPPATILHRCESAGCCDDRTKRCLPSKNIEVTLTFGIIRDINLEYFEVQTHNHTECNCQKITHT